MTTTKNIAKVRSMPDTQGFYLAHPGYRPNDPNGKVYTNLVDCLSFAATLGYTHYVVDVTIVDGRKARRIAKQTEVKVSTCRRCGFSAPKQDGDGGWPSHYCPFIR